MYPQRIEYEGQMRYRNIKKRPKQFDEDNVWNLNRHGRAYTISFNDYFICIFSLSGAGSRTAADITTLSEILQWAMTKFMN